MFENIFCKLTIGIDLISYKWFNCKLILVFYAANTVSMIHRISITKCGDAQINRVMSIVQVSALQTYMISIVIRNEKGSFAKKAIVNIILVSNILYTSLTDVAQTVFFKISVEICQFTKIARTDLNMYFFVDKWDIGLFLDLHSSSGQFFLHKFLIIFWRKLKLLTKKLLSKLFFDNFFYA